MAASNIEMNALDIQKFKNDVKGLIKSFSVNPEGFKCMIAHEQDRLQVLMERSINFGHFALMLEQGDGEKCKYLVSLCRQVMHEERDYPVDIALCNIRTINQHLRDISQQEIYARDPAFRRVFAAFGELKNIIHTSASAQNYKEIKPLDISESYLEAFVQHYREYSNTEQVAALKERVDKELGRCRDYFVENNQKVRTQLEGYPGEADKKVFILKQFNKCYKEPLKQIEAYFFQMHDTSNKENTFIANLAIQYFLEKCGSNQDLSLDSIQQIIAATQTPEFIADAKKMYDDNALKEGQLKKQLAHAEKTLARLQKELDQGSIPLFSEASTIQKIDLLSKAIKESKRLCCNPADAIKKDDNGMTALDKAAVHLNDALVIERTSIGRAMSIMFGHKPDSARESSRSQHSGSSNSPYYSSR